MATLAASSSRPTPMKRSNAPRSASLRAGVGGASPYHSTSLVATMPFHPSRSASSTYASRQGASPMSAGAASDASASSPRSSLFMKMSASLRVSEESSSSSPSISMRACNSVATRGQSSTFSHRTSSREVASKSSGSLRAGRRASSRRARQAFARFRAFPIVLHDLELALERLGQGLLIAALFFQLGNLAHRVPVFGIDLVEDEGVAGDGALRIVERLSEQLGLAKRKLQLLVVVLGQLHQAVQ